MCPVFGKLDPLKVFRTDTKLRCDMGGEGSSDGQVPGLTQFHKIAITLAVLITTLVAIVMLKSKKKGNLPPGPKPVPIFGNLMLMDDKEAAHRTFARLGEKYGPLMLMWMGSSPTVLISNAAMAEQVLKFNDQTFASRPYITAGKTLGFDFSSIVFCPFNAYYKRLRKIYTVELLSPKRIALSQDLRQIEVKHVMQSVLLDFNKGGPVNMTSKLQEMGIDNLVRMIFAKPNMGSVECLTPKEMDTLKGVVKEAVNLAGVIYVGDFIPLLDVVDFTVRAKITL